MAALWRRQISAHLASSHHVSHELRLLTSIIGFSQMLCVPTYRTPTRRRQLNNAERIICVMRSLLTLINNIS